MNQENSSVLDLLRQAVEAAAGDRRVSLSRPTSLPSVAMGVQDSLPQTNSPVVTNIVNGLAGLTGGNTEKPAWTEWVSRVNPIAGLVAGLFAGKRESAAPPPVATYLRPESFRLEAGFDGANAPAITAVERQEGGQFRPDGGTSGGTNGGPQVVVQVQAMDSRSFLDHTPEIAEAVKRALLESHGLRDVLGEY